MIQIHQYDVYIHVYIYIFIFSGPTHHAQDSESDAEKTLQLHSQPERFNSQRRAEQFYDQMKVAGRKVFDKNMKPHNINR